MNDPILALAVRLDERLHETPVDPHRFSLALDALVEEIAEARSQPARLLAMLARATPLLRAGRRFDEARRTASAAIALAELLEDGNAVFTNQLELARVMQMEKQFGIATPLFDRLIAQARSAPAFAASLHEVLHHAGANLLDQRKLPEAARYFRESQALRRAAGLAHLLEESAEALRLTRAPQGT